LFNNNGSSNATGWLGYSVSNSDGSHAGSLLEQNAGNTAIYESSTGTTVLPATVQATGNPAFSDGTYSFSLTVTRQASNALLLSYNLTRTSSTGYVLSGSFTDTTGSTFTFNRVGFTGGSVLKADQIVISNTDVTFTPIPEPASAGLLACGVLGLCLWRRRGGAASLAAMPAL
jgi:hypothetical protein